MAEDTKPDAPEADERAAAPAPAPAPIVVEPIPVPSFRKVEGDGYINWRMRPKPMGSADE